MFCHIIHFLATDTQNIVREGCACASQGVRLLLPTPSLRDATDVRLRPRLNEQRIMGSHCFLCRTHRTCAHLMMQIAVARFPCQGCFGFCWSTKGKTLSSLLPRLELRAEEPAPLRRMGGHLNHPFFPCILNVIGFNLPGVAVRQLPL